MTSLIVKVAELRELAAKDIPGKYTSDCPEYDYMVGMLNAAPGLLVALGKVQAGDAKILAEILSFIESEATESDWEDAIGLLRRYVDLARLMEDSP